MMLATIQKTEEPDQHGDEAARILADSDADLGDEVACMAVINASGVGRGRGSLMCLRIAAHNIRTQRLIVSKSDQERLADPSQHCRLGHGPRIRCDPYLYRG